MDALNALREWLDGLARSLAPRPKPAVVAVTPQPPRAPREAPRPNGGVYRPLKG
ncbi:MAG TPA: hypothetical protein VMW62_04530 [Chloroflexota bacterium]|nr:hypothetical protein [Chloroflexota bacterium]